MLKRKKLLEGFLAPLILIKYQLVSSKFKVLLFSVLFFSSLAAQAGEVSLAFTTGFLGTQGNNSNSTTNNLTFSTLGISRISFSQVDSNGDGKFGDGGTQGNDLAGTIRIYLTSGQILTLNGALNFRNSGNSRDIFGFIFDAGTNVSFTYGASQTYTIVKGNTASTSTSLGVRAYSSSYSIVSTFSGNASTSGLLDELNLELANSPQPTSITSPTVVEGNNLVYTVTLSSATSAGVPQVYTFTKSGTATASDDYTSTFTFSNGVTDNGDGTLTVPGGVSSFTVTASTIDDVTPEPSETLILNLGSKSGTGNITDNDVSLSTSVASLTTFSTCTSTASSAQSFTFSGNIYSGTVTVTAPTGFEISQIQNGTYTASIAYSFGSTTVSVTTVWVRAKSTATNGLSGNVTVATTGGTTQNVAASVTVNAIPTITVSPSTVTIVVGGSVTLTASGGSTYTWSPSTNLSASNTVSVTASPSATISYTVTGTSAGGCSNTAVSTITVNQALSAGSIAASQTICVGATPVSLTSSTAASGGIGTINYQWESSPDNSAWTSVVGATSATYSPGATSVNTYYRRKASTLNDAAVYTSSILITVQASVGGSISGSTAVCSGTNSTVLTLSGETGSITKWQSSLTSNFTSVTDIASTSASITATNLTATTYYRAVVTLGSCTAATSSVATVTVNALPTVSVNVIPDVNTSATSFTIPYTNLSVGADTYSLTTGTSALPGFATVSNANITAGTLTITIPASAQNSYDFNLTISNSTTGCFIQRTFNLVVSDMSPGTTGTDQVICYGTSPAPFTSGADASGAGGAPTYIWQISTTGITGTYTDIAGATSASYTHPTALTADTYFRRKATIGASFATAHPIEVIVNPLPVISVSPPSAVITTGSSVSLTASGADTYSWTPATGLSATNTASVSANPTSTTTYTITGTNSTTTTCSSTASVTISVNSALTAGAVSADQTICVGSTPAILTSTSDAAGGTGTIAYEWLSSTDGTTYNTISGATSSTYSPGAISVNTYFKRGVSTATDAVVYTSAILITVQESVGGTIAGSAAVCAGTNSTVLTLSGYTGSVTRWQSALAADFSGTVTNINSVSTSITETNLTATKYYRAVVRVGVCAASNSATATITVDALPAISVSPSAPSITSGSSVTLSASGASTYTWTPSTGLSATNTATVVASPTVTRTYTVTGLSASGCSSTASVTVTVNTPPSTTPVDTDGDGVTDTQEIADSTDPNDGCSYVVASRTLTPTAAWNALDCDADGNPNATDPHVDAPTASNDIVSIGNTGIVTVNVLVNDDFLPGPSTELVRQSSPNEGTAQGQVSFDPLTGEMTYRRAPFESGSKTVGYRVTNKGVTPAVSATAFVTIVACDLQDPLADCDGDGDPNGTDKAPTDPCVYSTTLQVIANVSDDWKALDCDGDGVLNGTELTDGTSPSDACSFKAGSITLAPSSAWLALDCDSDGVTNLVEGTKDFDGDGIPNSLDTDSDGDGISDKLETTVDTDKDGKPDYLDLDSDNDGILDSVENKVCTGSGILCDTDADGTPNFRDLDSDGDQIKDVNEANGTDFNKDGIADGLIDEKGIPASANKGLNPPDTDKDVKQDPYDVDSDGDGISDTDEELNEDGDFPDCDKDGIPNRLDPDECETFSPQGISPNGDGKNDRLVFKGLVLRKLPNHLSVYNRWGTLVFEMDDYDNSWSGTILPDGTYFYVLDFYGRKPTISNYLAIDRTIK